MRVAAESLARMRDHVANGLRKLAPAFPGQSVAAFRVVVHRDAESLSPALRLRLHPHTAGLAVLGANEMHVLLDEAQTRPPHDLRTVVVHELAHVLLDQWAGPAGPYVSRWFHEGLAQHLAGASYAMVAEEEIVWHLKTRTLPMFSDLHAGFPARPDLQNLAYAQSLSFVDFLVRRMGLRDVIDAARECGPDAPYPRAFTRHTGESLLDLQIAWEDDVMGSGAMLRFVLQNWFSYVMILAVPLLVIAAMRRMNRNHRIRQQLEMEEAALADDDGDDTDPERPR
jgi:hypothetical protein